MGGTYDNELNKLGYAGKSLERKTFKAVCHGTFRICITRLSI